MANIETAIHRDAVRARVLLAISQGCNEFESVLKRCEGADPALVEQLFSEACNLNATNTLPVAKSRIPKDADFLNLDLPAPDPSLSQWWFSGATAYFLEEKVRRVTSGIGSPAIFCLGTPSIAPPLLQSGFNVRVLDVDGDLCKDAHSYEYDAAAALPTEFVDKFDVALADPPWYDDYFYVFLDRCLSALKLGGHVFVTFPGALTKPDVPRVRAELLGNVVKAGHEIISIETAAMQYQVPSFEASALKGLKGFHGTPWRQGDLIHLIKKTSALLDNRHLMPTTRRSFHRNAPEFRIFLADRSSAKEAGAIERIEGYDKTVSTRGVDSPDIWSTEKVGAKIGDHGKVRRALELWRDRFAKDDAINEFAKDVGSAEAKKFVDNIDDMFQLWSQFGAEPPLRSDSEIKKSRASSLTAWATPFSLREHPEQSDGFRTDFQRDRDRILWSSGLRRLSNKTQLFPVEHDDDLRQRLAHSVEVLQIASTIGASFGLDNDLIEAGALAHDIGHTPFGHAGETALDRLFNIIEPKFGGFNHYEHGVDVLRYLEGPYHVSSVSQFSGLNLSRELCECVLKHTYCHNGPSAQSSEEILARSKHKNFIENGHCHLEGQAVRIADKISYLISDLEDGVRLGAVTAVDLLACRFFHRPPLRFEDAGKPLTQQFSNQRRLILKLLIEDVLRASNQRLARLPQVTSRNTATVRAADDYIIQYSDDMGRDVSEIWMKIQKARLHTDRRVVAANFQAARIVAELTTVFTLMPEMIDERFRNEYARLHETAYMKFYTSVNAKISIPPQLTAFAPMHLMIGQKYEIGTAIKTSVEQLVMAKDYVSALSDSRARKFHADLIGLHR